MRSVAVMLRTLSMIVLVVLAFSACATPDQQVGTSDRATPPAPLQVHRLSATDPVPVTTTSTTQPPPTTTTTAPPVEPSTTTTMPPSPPPRAAAVPAGVGTVNGYPCGGDLPTCQVLRCESGGNPTAENPRSSASGLWQILDGTWAGFGGYRRASHAPPAVQNQKAAQLWAGGSGRFHWAQCL